MERIELIPEKGQFYKVNMHCHTTVSDGTWTPEQVKDYYKSHGYSAVCYSDHDVLVGHEELCDKDFVALHACELSVKNLEMESTPLFMPLYHFNMVAKEQKNRNLPIYPREERKYTIEWVNGYLKEVSDAGFLINYNHPEWSLQNASDYIGLEHVHSFEVINAGCYLYNDNTSIHYHSILRAGKKLVPTAGDDNHEPYECGKAWTMIKAEELTYDALIAAYERGDCYVSEGPEIFSLILEDGKIKVKTSPASRINLRSEGRYVDGIDSKTETYTEAEFNYIPERMGRFFRVEVKDLAGYKAFTNAYYIEDIEKRRTV